MLLPTFRFHLQGPSSPRRILDTRRWDWQVVPKRQYPTTHLRHVTSQKTDLFISGLNRFQLLTSTICLGVLSPRENIFSRFSTKPVFTANGDKRYRNGGIQSYVLNVINLLAAELFFFLILAHPVYKMWKIQKPNMLELWNKLHFEEEKKESIYHV